MNKTKSLIYCGLFTALIAIGAFIKIPVPVVPFTLQFLFTMLAGLLLGSKRGTASVVAYMVLGKALTGGYIGHAVTVANHKVFQAFYSDNDRHALMHGPTFMGNALACAVALKGIEIFEREDYMSKIRRIEEISHREMDGFSDPRIREVRIMGGCTCVEVYDSKTLEGFQQFAYERGVFSRPFLKYMYSMVPYIIEEEELVKIFDTMKSWFSK